LPAVRIEIAKTLEILEGFDGLPSLKKLQAHLNLDPENAPISRRGWKEANRNLLAADPVITASIGAVQGLFGPEQSFKVVYCRLASRDLRRTDERAVVAELLPHFPYSLFVFSDAEQKRFHFMNVKDEPQGQKRRLFRRITAGNGERLRTAAEQLGKLDGEELRDLPLSQIQDRFDETFDVERVTQDFFRVFATIYHKIADEIATVKGLDNEAGQLSQLLLDRLLFLYFIQKKGWLNGEPDYLYRRFKEHHCRSEKSSSFYTDVLQPLFRALSDPDYKDASLGNIPFLNGGLFEEPDRQSQAERIKEARAILKNATFKIVFDNLLEKFNFTVTEDTPLDVEVAIDPEMLGKIFESLILQLEEEPEQDLRRITGSYYTPRSIVHFMCQQALCEFLAGELDKSTSYGRAQSHSRVRSLIDSLPADHLDETRLTDLRALFSTPEAKLLRQSILDSRICDPAVGSGAYPVGMLHEMVVTVGKLDAIIKGRSVLAQRNYNFELKKRIIDSCLYGVDQQEQAVRLCELRLWLSLVVDYDLDPAIPFKQAIRSVPALPNLSYRILRGDSLLERLFGEVVQLETLSQNANVRALIQSIQADKQAYFCESRSEEKRKLEVKILSKQTDLAEHLVLQKEQTLLKTNLSLFGESAKDARLRGVREQEEQKLSKLKALIHSARLMIERATTKGEINGHATLDQLRRRTFQSGESPSFLWRVDFAEVFAEKGGFDVVIGNPPYLFGGNTGISQDDKDAFRKNYRSGAGKVNLFTLFIERGLSLLAEGRPLVYIVPNTLLRVTSYSPTRELILKEHSISMIVDLGAGMFEDVTMSTIILSIHAGMAEGDHQLEFRAGLHGEGRRTEQASYISPGFVINTSASPADLRVLKSSEDNCLRLGDICKELIFGVVISGNRTGLVSNTPRRGWKPFLEGRDVERYFIRPTSKYLHYVPAEIHRPRTSKIFEVPEKLLIQRITGGARPLAAAYDNKQHYNKESINNLILRQDCPYDVKFLLALLNSTFMSWYYRVAFTNGSTLTVNLSKEYLSQLPIPKLRMGVAKEKTLHDEIVKLSEAMLRSGIENAKEHGRLNKLIDAAVYELYHLGKPDISVIEECR
jgi:hypothetical protein